MVGDWPSDWPLASLAVTAKYGPGLFTVIAVSKPWRFLEPAWASLFGLVPASTVQLATWVAPFQLAYTTKPPAGFTRAATAGLPAGWPAQSAVKARYDWSPTGNWPSSSSVLHVHLMTWGNSQERIQGSLRCHRVP